MQPVTDPPRSGLTPQEVNYLLTRAPSVSFLCGARVLNNSLSETRDISSGLLSGSSVSSDISQSIHRTCTLNLSLSSNVKPSDLVQPYITLTDNDTGVSASFNMGVYVLTSPSPDLTFGAEGAIGSYTGYDLLQLLNQPIADSISVSLGTDVAAAASAVVTSAIQWAKVNYTYPTTGPVLTTSAMSWALDGSVTYLTVVNDILASGGYLPVWTDWGGRFRMDPYTNPLTRQPEWVFDINDPNCTLAETRSSDKDLFGVPNRWRFVIQGQQTSPVEGSTQLTFVDYTSPTGVTNRGYQVNKIVLMDAVNYTALRNAAAKIVEEDLSPTETFNLVSYPLPLLWHRDVVQYSDPALAALPYSTSITRACLVTSWSLNLDGGNQSMVLQTVSPAVGNILP